MSTEVNIFNNSSTILTGKDGCQCANMSSVLASLVDRSCQTPDGEDGVRIIVTGQCVPYSYGSNSCLQHDLNNDPACQKARSSESKIPDYCSATWCYVEKSCARFSDEHVSRSVYFPYVNDDGMNVYYSYTTCGSSDVDLSLFGGVSANPLKGATIVAAVPGYWEPFHYKRDTTNADVKSILPALGPEYYNNSIPFEGSSLNYLESLVDIADGDFDVTYAHASRFAMKTHPESAFTAVVQDVRDGLADIGVGPFWVTTERLQMTPFTVPIGFDRTFLVIPEPGTQVTPLDQVYKVIEPFTTGVWIMLLVIITITAFLSVWFAGRSTGGRKGKKRLYARWFLDSFLEAGVQFCSHGVRDDSSASLPAQLLMFGFAFFVLIVLSAYVANLAAFLTRSAGGYDLTMKAVIDSGKRICTLPALKGDLEARWYEARFVYESSGEYMGMLRDYDAGKCDVLAVGDLDFISNMHLVNELCKRKLVATTSLIIENALAFPINPTLAAGFSYWMHKGEKMNGLSHSDAANRHNKFHNKIATCDIDFNSASNEVNELARITLQNLIFPIVFFFGFAVLAIMLQIYYHWAQRNDPQRRNFLGRESTMGMNIGPASAARLFGASAARIYGSPRDVGQSHNALSDEHGIAEEGPTQHGDEAILPTEESTSQPSPTPGHSTHIPNEDEATSKSQAFISFEESSSQPSPTPDHSTPIPNRHEAYSKFQQLVETGAMDDFFACFQAMKDKED